MNKEQVQSTFMSHHEEIRRRVESKDEQPGLQMVEAAENYEFMMESQKFVLFSISHVEMAPICKDRTQPAVRIYGTFDDRDSAVQHAASIQACDPNCNLQCDETHKWILACSSVAKLTDESYVHAKAERILKRSLVELEESKEEFIEDVHDKMSKNTPDMKIAEDAGGNDDDSRVVSANESNDVEVDGKQKYASVLNASCQVIDQQLVVVSFIVDKEDDPPEFLFKVYGCFPNKEESNVYVRNTAAPRVSDYNLDVCNTCQWLYPQLELSGQAPSKQVYRSSELTKIMDNHQSQPDRVEAFKRSQDQV